MKKLLAILLTLCMAVSLAACGSSSGGKSTTPANVGDVANGKTSVTITVGDLITEKTGDDAWLADRQASFSEKYPNITVNHIDPPQVDNTRLVQALSTLFVSKDAPVLMQVSAVQYARDLYNENVTADLSAYTGLIDSYSEVYPTITSSLTTTKKAVIGIPSILDVPLLGVRRSALEAAGIDASTLKLDTWDDYAALAEKLTTGDQKGASFWASEANLWVDNWAKSNGAFLAKQNEDGTIALNFTDDKFIQTIEYWRGLYAKGYVNQTINYSDLNDMFAELFNGSVASFTMYPSWASWFSTSGISADDVAMFPFPKGPSGDYYANIYPAAFVVNAKASSEEIEAAVVYVNYMYGKEAWIDRLQYRKDNDVFQPNIPPFQTIDWVQYNTQLPADWANATQSAIQNGYVTDLSSTAWSNYIVAVLPDLISGTGDIKATLQTAQDTATSEWLTSYNESVKSQS